ncbi:hypothetical protein CAEBREN_23630, partial [Caenorhabditis brenneri]
ILQICKEIQRPKAKVLESPHRSARILMITATPIKESYQKKLRQSATVLVDKKTQRITKYVSFDSRFNFEKNYEKIKPKDNGNLTSPDNGRKDETSSEKDKKVKRYGGRRSVSHLTNRYSKMNWVSHSREDCVMSFQHDGIIFRNSRLC